MLIFKSDALLYFWELPPTLNTSKWDVKGCAKVASTAQGTTCTTANTPQKQHQAREVYQECYEEWVRVRCTHRLTASPSCNADAVRATAHQQRTQGMLAPYTHFNSARAGQPHQQSCLCMRHAPSLMLGVNPPLHHAAAALQYSVTFNCPAGGCDAPTSPVRQFTAGVPCAPAACGRKLVGA